MSHRYPIKAPASSAKKNPWRHPTGGASPQAPHPWSHVWGPGPPEIPGMMGVASPPEIPTEFYLLARGCAVRRYPRDRALARTHPPEGMATGSRGLDEAPPGTPNPQTSRPRNEVADAGGDSKISRPRADDFHAFPAGRAARPGRRKANDCQTASAGGGKAVHWPAVLRETGGAGRVFERPEGRGVNATGRPKNRP